MIPQLNGVAKMVKSKASLYLRSNPHKPKFIPMALREYRVYIGCFNVDKMIRVQASSITDALNKGADYCRSDQAVLEVHQGDRRVWDFFDRVTP